MKKILGNTGLIVLFNVALKKATLNKTSGFIYFFPLTFPQINSVLLSRHWRRNI